MDKGAQTILIENDVINATGVYIYKLTTETVSHQGKLIKVD